MSAASDIITSVRYRLADQDDQSYSDAQLLSFLNDGQKEFAVTTGCLQTTHSFTVAGSVATLALTGMTYTYVNVYSVTHSNLPLAFAPRYEAESWGTAAAGTPSAWTVWGDTLTMDAIPAYSTIVMVYYTRLPTTLASTSSTLDFPSKYEPALVSYVEYRIREMDREDNLANRAYAEYETIRTAAANINAAYLMNSGYGK